MRYQNFVFMARYIELLTASQLVVSSSYEDTELQIIKRGLKISWLTFPEICKRRIGG